MLLFKSAFTIEKILEGQQNEGSIISGKVLDTSLRPCIVYLNSNDANLQCVIGPNRIYYDPTNGDDYKVYIPCEYLRMSRHPLNATTHPLVEVYAVLTTNREWKNANDMDFCAREHDID